MGLMCEITEEEQLSKQKLLFFVSNVSLRGQFPQQFSQRRISELEEVRAAQHHLDDFTVSSQDFQAFHILALIEKKERSGILQNYSYPLMHDCLSPLLEHKDLTDVTTKGQFITIVLLVQLGPMTETLKRCPKSFLTLFIA